MATSTTSASERGTGRPRNLVWQGKIYPSVKAVAEAAGVSQGYVYRLLSIWNGLEKLADRRRSGKSGAEAACGRRDEHAGSAGQKMGCA